MKTTSASNEPLASSNPFCGEYETLLDRCQLALSAWSDRSEHARNAQLTGEAVGRELLRLQAGFAKAYAVLQKHTRTCERCVAVSEMSELASQYVAPTALLVC